ncbi:MAG TPA: YbfB/YjiJ family MFS transporter [Jatrophihabitantaceae bacterium]|nr:YbfB/YjiJ family MFS transporter [Jatrophihabitantaceae bacterium]
MRLPRVPAQVPARGSWLRPVVLVMLSGAVSQGFARFTYPFVLPQMRDDLLGSYSAAGALGAVNLGSYLAGVLAMTWISRRVESTVLLKAGLFLTAGGLLLIAAAPSVPWVVVGMAEVGLCSAAVWVPAAGIVSAHAPEHRRGFAFGITVAGIGLSIAVTGQLVSLVHRIAGPDSWRPVWAIESGLAVTILVVQLCLLRRLPGEHAPDTTRRPLRELMPAPQLLLVSYFLYGASYAIFTNYLVAAVQTDLGISQSSAAQVYSVLGVASIFGGLVLGRISDRLERRTVLGWSVVGTGLLCLVVPAGVGPLAVPVALLYGLLMTGVGSVLFAYISDSVPQSFVAAAFGTITISLGLSQLVAPPFGGWLADRTGGFAASYLVAAVVGVIGGLLALRLPAARSRHHADVAVVTPAQTPVV